MEGEKERYTALMTATNIDTPLFQLYKTADFSGIALASMGPIKLVLFRLQTWPPQRDAASELGVRLLLIAASMIRLSCLFLT